ncbi:MAG TPA: monovalent cation:proton antiporter-2 (CPA2) family protein [Burkholderiales bacterium]|jgi:monovalent cation:proton antiporter-2 (CPA2) family protein|nr:monovalent cation:proton antiporter-2 (CPA2) family protein [Burkholderiales bacterium]
MTDQGFLNQALVYLAAAVIAVPISRRLGLGSVLGFLIAGAAIGPWGLRLIPDPATVLQFAEIGVVLLLFLVGLELEPRRLWALRRPIFGMGAAQVVVTIVVFAVLGRLLGLGWAVAIAAGMGLAMSSTAIGLATLAEKRLLQTPGGQASFSVLLFQDIAVIPLLLVLGMLSAAGDAHTFDWLAALKAVALIAALIIAGRFLLRPLLRYIAQTGLREIFIAFALLLVIGIASLMHAVGLSMALGAFLAGVLLADSEYRHELELDIDPFKGLLLGLFFIAVGMSVDLGLFVRSPLLVLGLALGVVLLKAALLYPLSITFGYCGRADATLFAIALSQVGEFAFVLFGVAASQKVLGRETVDLLNAVVAASMISTPLLMIGWERVIAPRLTSRTVRAPDVIEERNPVIVAGFGRFGQIVTRVLHGMGIGVTIIEHDAGQIETVRRFGWKAYYGDATRLDLLESAGARDARLLIVAIDDQDAAMRTVRRARERFPNLQVIVRAHSRTDAYEYVALGVPSVRETFGSALDAASGALQLLGRSIDQAREAVQQFRTLDEQRLVALAPDRNDEQKLIAFARRERENLNQLLTNETAAQAGAHQAAAPAIARAG